MSRDPAPLFVDATRLAIEVLQRFDATPGRLADQLCRDVLELQASIAQALRTRGAPDHIDQADERLLLVRLHLRLAHDLGQLPEGGLVHLLEQADGIGRQLGGWRRALGAC